MNPALFSEDEVPRSPKTWKLPLREDLVLDVLRGTKTETRRTGQKWQGIREGDQLTFCGHFAQVIAVRHEHLQDISDESCIAEGVVFADLGYHRCRQARNWKYPDFPTASLAFAALWDDLPIHEFQPGRRWDDNPEVTVISFRLVKAGE